MVEGFSKVVGSNEDVARVIFSPSYIYKGRVAPTAFRWEILPSGHVEDYVSVLRGEPSMLDSQTKSFRARTKGDIRYGYVLLNVGDIRRIGFDDVDCRVDVLAFPSRMYPNHAGIVVEMGEERVTALTPVSSGLMMIQKQLAAMCGDIVKFGGSKESST